MLVTVRIDDILIEAFDARVESVEQASRPGFNRSDAIREAMKAWMDAVGPEPEPERVDITDLVGGEEPAG